MQRILINTVGKSALLNLRSANKFGTLPPAIDLDSLETELKKPNNCAQAVAALVNILEQLSPIFNDPKSRLTPGEISSLTAIKVNEQDTLYFLAGVSDKAIADEGEVCGRALTTYFARRLGQERVNFVAVHGMVVDEATKLLQAPEEMLRELDNCVRRLRRNTPGIPIIINSTGGYRLSGIYASLVGLAYGYEIYYLHEDMRIPVGLPPIAPEIIGQPVNISAAQYRTLSDELQKYYIPVENRYERIGLVDIVARLVETTTPLEKLVAKKTILFLAASPRNQDPTLGHEEQRTISKLLDDERFDFKPQSSARYYEVARLLFEHKPYLVHFSGHGEASGELLFVDDHNRTRQIEGANLAEWLMITNSDRKNIECVVLNACHSETVAREIAPHVDYAIGMSDSVQSIPALAFATGFYQSLAADPRIVQAFNSGIREMKSRGFTEEAKKPVLYVKGQKQESEE